MKALKKLKLNSKGFGHVELLIVLVVIAAIVAAGIFVYKHDHKTTVAHAGSYTEIMSKGGITVEACKTYVNAYGGAYVTTFYFYKAASTNSSYDYSVADNRPGSNGKVTTEQFKQANSWLYGTVASETVDSSTLSNDWVDVSIGAFNTYEEGFINIKSETINPKANYTWSQIANC